MRPLLGKSVLRETCSIKNQHCEETDSAAGKDIFLNAGAVSFSAGADCQKDSSVSGDHMIQCMRNSLLVLLFASIASAAQTIPPVKAKSLDASEVQLPAAWGSQVLILVLGFSHKSADIVENWGKHISADFHGDTRVAYYQMPNLEGVPGFVKPMILKGMHKDVPPAEQSHFVPIYDHKSEWKTLVHFSAPDDAYLIVASANGHPIWQSHGPYSESTYNELKKAVSGLLENLPGTVPKSWFL